MKAGATWTISALQTGQIGLAAMICIAHPAQTQTCPQFINITSRCSLRHTIHVWGDTPKGSVSRLLLIWLWSISVSS